MNDNNYVNDALYHKDTNCNELINIETIAPSVECVVDPIRIYELNQTIICAVSEYQENLNSPELISFFEQLEMMVSKLAETFDMIKLFIKRLRLEISFLQSFINNYSEVKYYETIIINSGPNAPPLDLNRESISQFSNCSFYNCTFVANENQTKATDKRDIKYIIEFIVSVITIVTFIYQGLIFIFKNIK